MAYWIKISSHMNELNTMFMTRPLSFMQIIPWWCLWPFLMLQLDCSQRGHPFLIQLVAGWPNVYIMLWTCPKPNMFGPTYFIIDNWFTILVHQTISWKLCAHSIPPPPFHQSWIINYHMSCSPSNAKVLQMWILILEQYNQEDNKMTKTYVCSNNIVG